MRWIKLNKEKYFQNNFKKMENQTPVYNLLILDKIFRENHTINWTVPREVSEIEN